MLIINADDWGMDSLTTDRILDCFRHERISSTTAMMFMEDSERSAEIAREQNLPTGLHLNFTQPFTSPSLPSKLQSYHHSLVRYFNFTKKFSMRIIYNPLIQHLVEYCFKAQCEEFERLYGKPPTHIDGHHHIHLCANLMLSKIIPSGMKIRRNVPFSKKEKNFLNWWWRSLIDKIIKERFLTTEFFLSLYSNKVSKTEILAKLSLADGNNVEFMVHPGLAVEYDFLMSDWYLKIIQNVDIGSYEDL